VDKDTGDAGVVGAEVVVRYPDGHTGSHPVVVSTLATTLAAPWHPPCLSPVGCVSCQPAGQPAPWLSA
jgi:hypothetical protein